MKKDFLPACDFLKIKCELTWPPQLPRILQVKQILASYSSV